MRDVIGGGGSFEGLLRQWVANDCRLTGNSAAVMTQVLSTWPVDCCPVALACPGE